MYNDSYWCPAWTCIVGGVTTWMHHASLAWYIYWSDCHGHMAYVDEQATIAWFYLTDCCISYSGIYVAPSSNKPVIEAISHFIHSLLFYDNYICYLNLNSKMNTNLTAIVIVRLFCIVNFCIFKICLIIGIKNKSLDLTKVIQMLVIKLIFNTFPSIRYGILLLCFHYL